MRPDISTPPLSLLFLTSLILLTQATDTLTPGQTLTDGNSLISAAKVFEFGFFSPVKSTKRYLGIWYYNFSAGAVLWVANRDNPVPNRSGSLTILSDGNLILVDSTNKILWSTNASSLSFNQTTARLHDNGNLQISDSSGMVWQSFDRPTDTYLPGMKIGLNLTTNVNQVYTSWRSSVDPGMGNYSYGVDPDRSTQVCIWEGTRKRWRSGLWDGHAFLGIQSMGTHYSYGLALSDYQQEGKMYFYYSATSTSHRLYLDWNGIGRHMIWKDDSQTWSQYAATPITDCDLYNKCGNYGSCTDESTPICSCLQGFMPKSTDEWNNGNWMSGCIRRTQLQCQRNISIEGEGEPDGFLMLQGVKLPDTSELDRHVGDSNQCEETCIMNCSCRAYSFVIGLGCLKWNLDLMDIYMFSSGGNDFYLRLAGSELEKKKKMTLPVALLIVIIVLAIIFSIGCLYFVWKCRKRVRAFIKLRMGRRVFFNNKNLGRGSNEFSGGGLEIRDEESHERNQDIPLFSFHSIIAATEDFSFTNFLGRGGFGPVYKGKLPGGQEIAVKRLSSASGQGLQEFKTEVILISKLQHRNLVRLLGCCVRGEEKILIYEYMPNKSLDFFLFDMTRKRLLDWTTRYNIIEGIARGLLYLHRDSRLRVIHRDLKVSNILLDEEMNPKISDFGLARIFGNDDNESNTKRVVGTYGYMSPEYAMQGAFSVKSDVYSFGVLLLEIISGQKNSTFLHPELSLNLLSYAWALWEGGSVMEFVDPVTRDSCSPSEASRCIAVGLLCVQDRAIDRPSMASIVVMLESGTTDHYFPKQPTFAADSTARETDSSTSEKINAHVSITRLTGR